MRKKDRPLFFKRKRFPWKSLLAAVFICLVVFIGFSTPVPDGLSQKGPVRDTDFEFIYDLTYQQNNEIVHERNIFKRIKSLIKNSREFIIIDMFLFNDDYDRKNSFTNISEQLTTALINQKKRFPNLKIVFITDEINTFYGSYPSKNLERLKENGIEVVITDLTKIPDPNPLYSGIWRLFQLDKIDTAGDGWLPNPFSPDSPDVTLRAYLRLLNFKANHRKVIISENEAVVTSFNPHDASGNHSNIAFCVKSEIIDDLLESEKAIMEFSSAGSFSFKGKYDTLTTSPVKAQLLTEGKIKEELIREIESCKEGDKIKMAMFYLAEHEVIQKLIEASDRGVAVKLILDANKDAFGIEKNGVPNRPAAYKLVNESRGKIEVRWYNSHGEQFHSKMTIFEKGDQMTVIGGSANLTRRNIEDYNLETDLKIILPRAHTESKKIDKYFSRLWNNKNGDYTLDFSAYEESSLRKRVLYEIQERTGLSSF